MAIFVLIAYSFRMSNHQTPYFIGIALPEQFSEQLFSLKWNLHTETSHSLKPLVPHITLLHPSSLQTSPPEEMAVKIQELAARYLPLTLTLEIIASFASEVLYISIASHELRALQAELVTLLPTDKQEVYHQRDYQPHVTLLQTRAPHTLNIEEMRERVSQEVPLPYEYTTGTISCFTRIRPREYARTDIR